MLDTLIEAAVKLTGAKTGILRRREGDVYPLVASFGLKPEWHDLIGQLANAPGHDSLVGRVTLEGRTVQIPDVFADPDFSNVEAARTIGFRANLGTPLHRDGQLIGYMAFQKETIGPFSARQVELIETFANQAVIAIENARLLNELRESLQQQTATADVLKVISRSAFDLNAVLDTLVRSAARLCDADMVSVTRPAEGEDFHHHVANFGFSPEWVEYMQTYPLKPERGTLIGRTLLEGKTIHIPDVLADQDYTATKAQLLGGHRAVLGVPLLRVGAAIGVFMIARRTPRPFTAKQIELIETFADQAVIAIENTRLFEEVQARTRELEEALDFQTATSDVLGVISRSPNQLQPVLDAIVTTAFGLCPSDRATIMLRTGDHHRFVAGAGFTPDEMNDRLQQGPIPIDRGSVSGRVALEGRTIHVQDVKSDPDYTHWPEVFAHDRRTVLGVPLVREGLIAGVIILIRSKVEPYNQRQIELVETFADQAVIAINNVGLFEELQARTGELQEALEYQTATGDVLSVISRSKFDLQPVLDTIAEGAARLCGGLMSGVFRYDGELMHLGAMKNFAPGGEQTWRKIYPRLATPDTATGRAVLQKAVVIVPDVGVDSRAEWAHEVARTGGYRSAMAVPMLREGLPIGAIVVARVEPGSFPEAHVELLKTFADQAVIAIENTRLFEEVQARNRDLTALGEIGRTVSSTLDLNVVLKTIVERAVDLSGTDGGSIFYYRDEVGRFELGETTGLDEETIARFRKLDIATGETGLGEAINQRQPLQVPDILKRPSNTLRDAALEAGLRAALIVPLFAGEGPLGALVLQRRQPGDFSPTVVNLVQSFADQSAIALENARLFDEIAQKSRELEIASQHKSQFVANMSHELRTPLAAILGYAELMQEGFYEPQGKKSLDALTRIRSNGKHLLGLINTVLDIAKIESGQFSLNLSEYALDSVVETVRAATESLAETKKLALKTEVGHRLPIGLGDEQRLTQVLLNLVGNAIKFTDTGEVRIIATAVNNHFTVGVTDTGPGIPSRSAEARLRSVPPDRQLQYQGQGRNRSWPRHRQADRRDARWSYLG